MKDNTTKYLIISILLLGGAVYGFFDEGQIMTYILLFLSLLSMFLLLESEQNYLPSKKFLLVIFFVPVFSYEVVRAYSSNLEPTPILIYLLLIMTTLYAMMIYNKYKNWLRFTIIPLNTIFLILWLLTLG